MAANPTWLALTRASALGWVPASKKNIPKMVSTNLQLKCDKGDILKINVSGVHFEAYRWQLEKQPHTLLGSSEKEYFWNEERQEYFFNRDPIIFRYILNYYMTNRLHFPRQECVSSFEEELSYFGVPSEYVDECCYEEFKDKQRDNDDRTQCQADDSKPVYEAGTVRDRIYNVFQNPDSGFIARAIYYITGFFIAVSVIANIVDTIPYGHLHEINKVVTLGEFYSNAFFVLDTTCVALFTIEYILRFYAAPNRVKYVRSIMSIIDLAAIIPYYVSLGFTDNTTFAAFVTLRVFRVFRIFKFSRHSAGLRILGATLRTCASELGFLLFSLAMAVIIFATVIYYCERNVPDTSFVSIPATFWYTIVTITTLGYGDIVPSTILGKIVGGVCSLSGVLVIALPVPVIVSNFSRIYVQNQRVTKHKLMIRCRLKQMMSIRKMAAHAYIIQKQTNAIVDGADSISSHQGSSHQHTDKKIEMSTDLANVQQQFHLLWSLEATTARQLILSDAAVSKKTAKKDYMDDKMQKNCCLRIFSRNKYGRRGIMLARRCSRIVRSRSKATVENDVPSESVSMYDGNTDNCFEVNNGETRKVSRITFECTEETAGARSKSSSDRSELHGRKTSAVIELQIVPTSIEEGAMQNNNASH